MAWPKGRPRPPNSGRKAGTPNKDTEAIRLAIVKSFDHIGGWKYLVRVAREQPAAYCSLLARLLPHELASGGGPLKQEIILRWMDPQMARNRGYLETPTEEETETETSGD